MANVPNTKRKYNPISTGPLKVIRGSIKGVPNTGISRAIKSLLSKSKNNKPKTRLFGESKKLKPNTDSQKQLQFKLAHHAKAAELFRLRHEQHIAMSKKETNSNDTRLHKKLARMYLKMADKHDKQWSEAHETASKKPVNESKDSKANDFLIAKAIKKTLNADRRVEIDGSPISKADWAKDRSNPERKASSKTTSKYQPPDIKRTTKTLKIGKSLKNRKLTYEGIAMTLLPYAGQAAAGMAIGGVGKAIGRLARLKYKRWRKQKARPKEKNLKTQPVHEDAAELARLAKNKYKRWAKKKKKIIPKNLREDQIVELHGKGSLPAIKKHHEMGGSFASQATLPKKLHNLNARRASRLSNMVSGKSPVGKPDIKKNLSYAADDSAKARKMRNEEMDITKIQQRREQLEQVLGLVTELSNKTLKSYASKAITSFNKPGSLRTLHRVKLWRDKMHDVTRKEDNRIKGTDRAARKLWDRSVTEAKRGRPRKNPLPDGNAAAENPIDEPDNHIINQLRKVETLRGQKPVLFKSGEHVHVPTAHAKKALDMFANARKPAEKEDLMNRFHHSVDSFKKAIGHK